MIPGYAHGRPCSIVPSRFPGFSRSRCSAGIAVLGVAGSQPAPPDPVDPELREIIERALERAAWAEEEGFETRYRRAMTQRVQRFNGDGEVTDDETLLYQVEPYQGALFSRLMARDGEPTDARGRREQERRWEEFQGEIDDPGKAGGARAGSRGEPRSSSTKSWSAGSRPGWTGCGICGAAPATTSRSSPGRGSSRCAGGSTTP